MLTTVFDEILATDTFEEWRQKLNAAIQGLEEVSVVANEIEKISLLFSYDESLSSGLNVHIREGVVRNGSQTFNIAATLVPVLNTNGIHIIHVDVNGSQVVSTPLAGTPTVDIIPLYRVTVAGGVITEIKDVRTWANVFIDTSLVISAKQEEVFDLVAPQTVFVTTIDDTYINNISVFVDGLRLAQGVGEDYEVSSDAFNKVVVTLASAATAGQRVLVVANQDDHTGNVQLVYEVITATSNGQTVFTLTDPELIPATPTLAVYVQGVRQHSYTIPNPNEIEIGFGVSIGTEVLVVKNEAGGSDNLAILEAGTDGQILYKVVAGPLNTVEWRDPEFDASVIISGTINHNRIPKATVLEVFQGDRNDVFVTPATLRASAIRSSIDHWHKLQFSSAEDFRVISTAHPSHLQKYFAATRHGAVISDAELLTSWNDTSKHLPHCPMAPINAIATIPFDYSSSGNEVVIAVSNAGFAHIVSSGGTFNNSSWVFRASNTMDLFFDEKVLDVQIMIHKKASDEPIVFVTTQKSSGLYCCYRRTLNGFITNTGGWTNVLVDVADPIYMHVPVSRHAAGDTNDGTILIANDATVRIIRDTAEDGTLETITDTAIGIAGSDYITAVIGIRNGTTEDWDVLVGTNAGRIFRRNTDNIVTSVASAYTEVTYPTEIPYTAFGRINKFLPTNNTVDQLLVLTDNFIISAINEDHNSFTSENNMIGGKLVAGMEYHAMTCGANTYLASRIEGATKVVAQNEMGDLLVAFPTNDVGNNASAIRFTQTPIKAHTSRNSPAPIIEVVDVSSRGNNHGTAAVEPLTAIGTKSPVNTIWVLRGNSQGGYPVSVQGELLAVAVIESVYETNGADIYVVGITTDGVYINCPYNNIDLVSGVNFAAKTARPTVKHTGFTPKPLVDKSLSWYVPVVNKNDTFVIYGDIDYGTPASVETIGGYQIELTGISGTFIVGQTITWTGGSGIVKGNVTTTRIVLDNATNLSDGESITGPSGSATVAVGGIIRFEPVDGHATIQRAYYISPEVGSATTKVCYHAIANINTNKGAVQYLPVGGVDQLPTPSGFNYTTVGTIYYNDDEYVIVGTDNGKLYAAATEINPALMVWSELSLTINEQPVSNMGGAVQEITCAGNGETMIAKISTGKYYISPNGSDWIEISIPTKVGNSITRITANEKSSYMFGESVINRVDNQPPSFYKMTI